jgi:hypothetical protein
MLTLKDGRVLVVSDESVALYLTMEEAQAGSGGDRPVIYL